MTADGAAGLWWTRTLTDEAVELCGYDNGEHEPGVVLEVGRPDLSPLVVARSNRSGSQVEFLLVNRGEIAPRLWWVEHPETAADPPAMTLIAFPTADLPASSVVGQPRFRSTRVASSAQVGALRWWPATGQIHQIYVAPEQRRQGIGTSMAFAVAAYARLRDWSLLWASGQRTDLGEAFVTTSHPVISGRVEERTHNLPPMTPTERAVGLPRRLLEPDQPV